MKNQEELFLEVRTSMAELFELNPEDIKPDSCLVEDLDLDSIDAVDMIVSLQKKTGKRIKPEEFQAVKTVQDVVDVLERLMAEQQKEQK